ncbi:tetratricopeptide repeat protein [Planctomycetota bacterium]
MADNKENPQKLSDDSDSYPPLTETSGGGLESSSEGSELLGQSIGPYKLLSILGEGGFGIVYLAEQQRPIRRQVALKIIKPGMDSKPVISRFERERQALVLLNHNNVARVFDGGTTGTGRPYFVMELVVDGLEITKYCDKHKLSIEKRLRLFLQVCEAIQYAHQKGIIHRDLKPSNILVMIDEGRPIPKVIDFGIAKTVSLSSTEQTLTGRGQVIGTPSYMSPEQIVSNEDIDIRSDIYSLGMILYELLIGVLPFKDELIGAGFAEIERIVREIDPPRPSTRLSSLWDNKAREIAESRCTDISALTKCMYKELEWIPLMALRKEPSRRYQSASELAADISNYLVGDLLIAGPESTAYRVRKLIHRNRALVIGTAVVFLVLLLGVVTSLIFATRSYSAQKQAERQVKISQAVLDFLNDDLLSSVDPKIARGQEVTMRQVLDTASEKIMGKFWNEPLIEAAILGTLGRTYLNLGEYGKSESHLDRELQLKRRFLGEEHPDTLNAMHYLASLYLRQGRYNEAEPLYVKVLELRRHVQGEEHPDTVNAMINLAILYVNQGRYNEAELLHVKTLEFRSLELSGRHMSAIHNLASLYLRQGRFNEAEPLYFMSLELGRRVLGEEHPDTLNVMNNVALFYVNQGRYDKAEPLYIKSLEIGRRVLGEEHPDTLKFMINFASLYLMQERYDEAEPLYVKSLKFSIDVLGKEHPNTQKAMVNLANLYFNQKRYDEAEPLYVKSLEIVRRVLGGEHPDTLDVMYNLAVLYEKQGRYNEVETLYSKALDVQRRILGEEHPDTLQTMHNLAALYLEQGRYEEAESLCVKLLELASGMLGEEHPSTQMAIKNLGGLYLDQGRYEEAEPLVVKTLGVERRVLGEEHPDTLNTMIDLSAIQLRQRQYEKAEPLCTKVLELASGVLGEEHTSTQKAMTNLAILYFNQERYGEAEPLFVKILELRRTLGEEHSDTLDVMSVLAHVYHEQGRHNEALDLILEARLSDSDSVINMNGVARLLSKNKGWHQEAMLYVERGLKLYPNHVDLLGTRGNIHIVLGQYDRAIVDLTKCIDLYPADTPQGVGSRFRLGKCLARVGRRQEAINWLNAALDLSSRLKGGLTPEERDEAHTIKSQLLNLQP